jgi:hypothetical protein
MTVTGYNPARPEKMRRGAGRSFTIAAGFTAAIALAACGSGAQQDAKAPGGNFPIEVITAKFPKLQRLAQHTHLVISVRNVGTKTIPNVAVSICNTTCAYPAPVGQGTSVAAFAQYLSMPGLASHSRPVWVIDRPPGQCGYSCQNGGEGAYVSADANTWQGGALKPGATATFRWAVTAVAAGRFVVAYQIAGDLYGKAKAVLPDGLSPAGRFPVIVAHAPGQSFVNNAGKVVQGR